jgi:hypothetical protein
MMGSDNNNRHLAEILDAGAKGMRVRVLGQADLEVGHEVEISSLSAHRRIDASRLQCSVAWRNPDNFEVGLKYLQ